VCKENGFQVSRIKNTKPINRQDFEESIYCSQKDWNKFASMGNEYRVILDLKEQRVGAVTGWYFLYGL